MSLMSEELSDLAWKLLEPLMPTVKGSGRPYSEHRKVLAGILWLLRTGAPWRSLPREFGPWQTAYKRFARWRSDGTWQRIIKSLQTSLEARNQIDWSLFCVDGTNIRASRAAGGALKKSQLNRQENPSTMLWG